jgi:hypothetical protein
VCGFHPPKKRGWTIQSSWVDFFAVLDKAPASNAPLSSGGLYILLQSFWRKAPAGRGRGVVGGSTPPFFSHLFLEAFLCNGGVVGRAIRLDVPHGRHREGRRAPEVPHASRTSARAQEGVGAVQLPLDARGAARLPRAQLRLVHRCGTRRAR